MGDGMSPFKTLPSKPTEKTLISVCQVGFCLGKLSLNTEAPHMRNNFC